MFQILVLIAVSFSLAAQAADKVSLVKVTSDLKYQDQIRALYKKTIDLNVDPTSQLKPLLKANRPQLEALRKDFSESTSFVRGEIEHEQVLNGLMHALELSMLTIRSQCFQLQWREVQNQFADWFLFAADFPYEESSLVGLRTAGVVRSLLLDELERIQKKFRLEIAKDSSLRKWFLKVRAPWPVDRVLISEAKRLLKPPMMSVAISAAAAFQKNPYQTSEMALKKVRGGQSKEADLLKQIWRESDIKMMKTEINRVGKLKLRFAQAEYEWTHKKAPGSVQDLLNAHLLDQVPVDYFTGKPLDLTSL